ncbi:hypothetical protein T05_7243 [Trichinella murrelli]|uniref:Uncharacterized protein n=1 Tax=Trichinella murrelli TaxID=144512 RepID=A0A0V0STL7_9BILA|nr:hypothetical protein T05_7243 [Trichinella murrelli]
MSEGAWRMYLWIKNDCTSLVQCASGLVVPHCWLQPLDCFRRSYYAPSSLF